MKLLIIHLSDIHIRNAHDQILRNPTTIADAVKNIDRELDAALVVVTGDIAYSGADDQYTAAENFLTTIIRSLSSKLTFRATPVIALLPAPGNHDCDFTHKNATLRQSLIDSGQFRSLHTDPVTLETVTSIQSNYFAFQDRLANSYLISSDPLQRIYRVPCGLSAIDVVCLNSAFLSQKHEKQGALFFPSAEIAGRTPNTGLVLSLLHHTESWFATDNGRELRRRLQTSSDLVLTGHEHDPDTYAVRRSGHTVGYVEGGVLQDSSKPGRSHFNAVLLDLDTRQYRVFHYDFDRTRYRQIQPVPAWEPLGRPDRGITGHFSVRESFATFLDDADLPLTHRGKRHVVLDDFFVYPDIREISPVSGKGKFIKSSQVPSSIIADRRVIVSGESQSGKSAMSKQLFRYAYEHGLLPILLTARDDFDPDGFSSSLEALCLRQYENVDLDEFRQLDRSKFLVIVDDFEKRNNRRVLADALFREVDHVVFFAHDLTESLLELSGHSVFDNIRRYHIQPFGYVLRHEFVKKWISIGGFSQSDELQFRRQVLDVEKIIDGVVGNSFVPAYPVFLMAVLQAAETSTPLDTTSSTQGGLYEVLIKGHLLRKGGERNYDVVSTYLIAIAREMFRLKKQTLTTNELRDVHAQYVEDHDITRDASEMCAFLSEATILRRFNGNRWEFHFQFLYYYFSAAYLRDTLSEPETRAAICEMANSLHLTANANILLFLAHLSRDPVLIDEVLRVSNEVFEGVPPAQLEEDVLFLGTVEEEARRVVLKLSEDPARSYLETLDQNNQDTSDSQPPRQPIDPPDNPLEPVARVNRAIKAMEVLGQILKNFPGSLTAKRKFELAKACYELGLRTMGYCLGLLKDSHRAIVKDIAETLEKERLVSRSGKALVSVNKHPAGAITSTEVEAEASAVVVRLAKMISYGVIRRTGNALAGRDLERTQERALEAVDGMAARLIDFSIKTEQGQDGEVFGRLQELLRDIDKESFAFWNLQALVIRYLNVFPLAEAMTQRLAGEVDVKVGRVTTPDQRKRSRMTRPRKPRRKGRRP